MNGAYWRTAVTQEIPDRNCSGPAISARSAAIKFQLPTKMADLVSDLPQHPLDVNDCRRGHSPDFGCREAVFVLQKPNKNLQHWFDPVTSHRGNRDHYDAVGVNWSLILTDTKKGHRRKINRRAAVNGA